MTGSLLMLADDTVFAKAGYTTLIYSVAAGLFWLNPVLSATKMTRMSDGEKN